MFFFVQYHDKRTEIISIDTNKNGWPKMSLDGGEISSRSRGYESIEELREDQGIIDSCSLCGHMFSTSYMEPVKSEMVKDNICFNCHFWTKHISPSKGIVIAGRHYTIGPEPKEGERHDFLGMAGREFHVLRDGKVIVTHNLWYQGKIPDHLRHLFPDNAEFIDGAGFVQTGSGGAWNESRSSS